MPLRLIEIALKTEDVARLDEWPGERPIIDSWRLSHEGCTVFHALIDARDAEAIVDELIDTFDEDSVRMVSLAVESTLPRPPEPEKDEAPEAEEGEKDKHERSPIERVSREELYADLEDSSELTRLFLVQVVLSTVVACIGVLRDDTAVIVGAMVIAPLLGPNVALGFGATLGDLTFIRRALLSNLVGVGLALALSFGAGLVFPVDPEVGAIASRVQPDFPDVLLALAAGVAGTLAVTSGMGTALIGVMVAVALLPPLTVAGMLAGAGYGRGAGGAAVLVTINIICVNLASVGTFILLGVRPRAWWDGDGAHRTSRLALLIWAGALLLVLIGLLINTVL